MAKTTQDNRTLKLMTPLGYDYLMISRLRFTEGLSELYRGEIEIVHEEDQPGMRPTPVDPKALIGQPMNVTVEQIDGTKRYFDGVCIEFTRGSRDPRLSHYRAVIVPKVWGLTQSSQSRIFQNETVPDIIKKVLEGYEVDYEIQGTFEPRNYCVQYRETDWDFASRLMEEEGIYYYFEHNADNHRMIVANTERSHRECPARSSLPFVSDVSEYGANWSSAINSYDLQDRLRTGTVELWDYHFQIQDNNLMANATSIFDIGKNKKLERYDFPGDYAKRFDGIDQGGGDQDAKLQKVFQDRIRTTKIRQEELDVEYHSVFMSSGSCAPTAGYRFKLTKHPNEEFNISYVCVSLVHDCYQTPDYITGTEMTHPYSVALVALPHGEGKAPFRPERRVPKPIIYGSQTAKVVGPPGEEIFVDKYGRVKVMFHWDRHGKADQKSSCWVRVGTSIAGNKWGTMFIPRIGQEVIVDFMEGDPDQPIIIGEVYNPKHMPHYELPKFKTLSYIKTRTTPDNGKGFNELRFEDKQGKEQVFVHSEKRYDLRVKGSMYETCGGNRHEVVGMRSDNKPGGNLAISVGGNFDLHVKGDQYIGIDTDLFEGVKGNVTEGYKGNQSTIVTKKADVNARTITLEALTGITLKVGGSFITVDLTGITIQGPFVKINSGGAATGTDPALLGAPLDAEPADTGEPGYLDKPRKGGGGGGRRWEVLTGQHAPENIVRNDDGTYQMGSIVVGGDEQYQQAVLSDLATINSTESGQQLLQDLEDSGKTTTIAPGNPPPNPPNAFAQPGSGTYAEYQAATPAGQPVYDGAGNPLNDSSGNQLQGTGTGVDSQVEYNPEQWPDPSSDSQAPGDVILFHELQHSKNQQNGQYDGTPRNDGFDTNEEFNAIGPENEYRDERDVPRRTNHHDL